MTGAIFSIEHSEIEKFTSASVVLPLMNETHSLETTVRVILQENGDKIKEILIVVCERTTPAALAAAQRLQSELGDRLVVHRQKLPFLGGAFRDGFELASGSHTIMMASDLETDPRDVKRLIAEAEKSPAAVVATSRWLRKGDFHGYSRCKLACNWLFQRCLARLYRTSLTDLTYAYRLMPTQRIQAVCWEELRHPFNLEVILKLLRLGVPAIEVPFDLAGPRRGTIAKRVLRQLRLSWGRAEGPAPAAGPHLEIARRPGAERRPLALSGNPDPDPRR